MNALSRRVPVATHAGLANAITLTGALFGITGAMASARGGLPLALTCAALALPCDVLDGAIARRRGTASVFGGHLDSLADAASFCLLPALLAMSFRLPWWVGIAQVMYAACGLLRLARFSELAQSAPPAPPAPATRPAAVPCFEGIPTAQAAALVIVTLAMAQRLDPSMRAVVLTVVYLVLAVGMISAVPVRKHGWHVRALWLLVPSAVLSVWFA